jgi:hypothetical protein
MSKAKAPGDVRSARRSTILRAGTAFRPGYSAIPTSLTSAVIFSNAATLAKFNRMGFLAGWRPPGLTMTRRGILFDRTPGALEPIDFDLSVDSAEYQALWPWGEAWCQELEVFHNPQATHPIPFDLIPGATHWFERGGDVECNTMWANSVISSITHLRMAGAQKASGHDLPAMHASPSSPIKGASLNMETEPSDRTIVLHLLRGAVPERADEISGLWSQYGHGVEVAPSTKGVTMKADDKRIQFDTKTIDFFWLLGFSAWRAIEVYSPALLVATWTGMPLDQALKIDAERGQYEFDYKQRVSTAQSLIAAEQTAQIFLACGHPSSRPLTATAWEMSSTRRCSTSSRLPWPSRCCTNSGTSCIAPTRAHRRHCPRRKSAAITGPASS